MPAGGLLALLDDITAVLDDVALMTKVAAAKTAGATGDDIAVKARALTGSDPKRELPIVWRVAKGSLRNKAILVPVALLLSVFTPWSITPLLMLGGAYLCYEAAETVFHAKTAKEIRKHVIKIRHLAKTPTAAEDGMISRAVRTDFILSAEIVALALAAVAEAALPVKVMTLCIVSIGMTVGVYGLVGMIVKLDDLGLYLSRRKSRKSRRLGRGLIAAAPLLMKVLSVVGTIAMFIVGGGIIAHGSPFLAVLFHEFHDSSISLALAEMSVGIAIGSAIVLCKKPIAEFISRAKANTKRSRARKRR